MSLTVGGRACLLKDTLHMDKCVSFIDIDKNIYHLSPPLCMKFFEEKL